MRRYETRTLHFDGLFTSRGRAFLRVGSKQYLLTPHTPQTRREHRALNPALQAIPDDRLAHFVREVRLTADMPQLLFVTTDEDHTGILPRLLLTKLHVPIESRRNVAIRHLAEGHPITRLPHPKFMEFGVRTVLADNPETIIQVDDFTTALDAATTIITQHPELISLAADTAAEVQQIATFAKGISQLAAVILTCATSTGTGWVSETPYTDLNLQPDSQYSYYQWVPAVKSAMATPLADTLRTTKAMVSLQSTSQQAGLYVVQNGTITVSGSGDSSAATATQFPRRDASSSFWTTQSLTPMYKLQVGGISFADNRLSTSFTNSALHYLCAFAEFLNDKSQPIEPSNWTSNNPQLDTGSYKYLAFVPSVETILAIPLSPDPVDVEFTWPSNATSVRFVLGGLGLAGNTVGPDGQVYTAWNPDTCLTGAIYTGLFTFAIPMICLVSGVLVPASTLSEIAKEVTDAVIGIAENIMDSNAKSEFDSPNLGSLLIAFANIVPILLLKAPAIAQALSEKVEEGAAEKSTPVLGWIATAASMIVDGVLLIESTVDLFNSPASYAAQVTRAVDVQWMLTPDERSTIWPREATLYSVTAILDDGTTRQVTGNLPPAPNGDPITVRFDSSDDCSLPFAAQVKFIASFYAATGWLCGSAQSGLQTLDPDGNDYTVPQMAITESLIPLTSTTFFNFQNALVAGTTPGSHLWSQGGQPPQAVVKNLNTSPVGSNLGAVSGIGVNQPTGSLVYTWQASGQSLNVCGSSEPGGQTVTIQAVSLGGAPDSALMQAPCAFAAPTRIAIDRTAAASAPGAHFFIDPRSSVPYLRELLLTGNAGTFDYSGGAWGSFNAMPDAIALHPAGYIGGVHTGLAKLEILKLPATPVVDADAPVALLYAGYGARPGLLHAPVALTGLAGSGFAILEATDASLPDGQARVQVLDFFGNPCPVFPNQQCWFFLTSPQDKISMPVTLLDIAVDVQGYFFLLKYVGDGSSVNDYYVDVYTPQGIYLTQQGGVSGGKLAVDLWRTVYVLSYEIISGQDASSTQPAIATWTPQVPSGPPTRRPARD